MAPMTEMVPLSLMRIWCRINDAWLSFKTRSHDRYLVNPAGYFIELPDGSLSSISPRLTFSVSDRFPVVPVDWLLSRPQYGENAVFVSVPLNNKGEVEPRAVTTEQLACREILETELVKDLPAAEQYVLCKGLECGFVPFDGLPKLPGLRRRYGSTGSVLLSLKSCSWEQLLGTCLDTRPPSKLDPPSLRNLIERREWELTGEILIALDKINRTKLEYALKIKREGSQALGQILTVMGACSNEDVEYCLNIQNELKMPLGAEVALIGKLLVVQGIITEEQLEEALRNQRIARQPLGRILVSMGACSQRDIDSYARAFGVEFQSEIDDINLGNHLVKIGTIPEIVLDEARRLQVRGRQVLGEMLVSLGLCSNQDIEGSLRLQSELRDRHRSGVERLGALLIEHRQVKPTKVEEAVQLQSLGRQPIGAILVALKACSVKDVMLALEIQGLWRSKDHASGDRLGEILVKQGIITEAQLHEPLLEHMREERPLGRILINRGICTPEHIIDALIRRDRKRQMEFLDFVRHESLKRRDDDI